MSWFSKKKNIAVVVGVAILFVVSAVSLIYAIATHEEPTLLEVCWTNDGRALYPKNTTEETYGACSRGQELVWPEKQIPLSVAAVTGVEEIVLAPGTKRREALDQAIQDINSQVGCKVLSPTAFRDGSAILAHLGTAVVIELGRSRGRKGEGGGHSSLGYARHRREKSGELLRCNFSVSSRVNNLRGEYLVTHHELLHCLGLSHDPDNPSSAIFPFTYDDTMWDSMISVRITDNDRAKLRDLYCQ